MGTRLLRENYHYYMLCKLTSLNMTYKKHLELNRLCKSLSQNRCTLLKSIEYKLLLNQKIHSRIHTPGKFNKVRHPVKSNSEPVNFCSRHQGIHSPHHTNILHRCMDLCSQFQRMYKLMRLSINCNQLDMQSIDPS